MTKEESRQKILQAAFAAFAETGYSQTSMDDIVKRSGLSKGTLYWHFKNKQELFLATVGMVMNEWDTQLAQLAEAGGSADERIRTFFAQAGAVFTENKNFIGLMVDAFFQSYQMEEAGQIMNTIYTRFIGHIERIVQQGIDNGEFREVDPHMAAVSLMAGGDGVSMYILFEPDWDVGHALNTMIDLILRGLRKEEAPQPAAPEQEN
ncbi:MAG: TetR/AcrR family transcriptional regulator [Anaerolineae bacterium]|nr:TetR/AcrR family transcriptional regulator [Anaerolineae bacterium]